MKKGFAKYMTKIAKYMTIFAKYMLNTRHNF